MPLLDRVIDINYYPTSEAEFSNHKWRPVGLGLMGLQDVFFKQGLAFDSADAKDLSRTISAHIYFHALWASTELAEVSGPHEAYEGTRAAKGDLQFDLWDTANGGVTPPAELDWDALRARITAHGLRNSLLIAIAPTATIASIVGCYECIEPQVSNLFKRETLSGEFMQINRYLVRELQARGLWDEQMINDIKKAEGSVQDVDRIPDRAQRSVPHGVGDPAAGTDRHGCRARRLHRPEPVAQPLHGDAHHRQALLDVPARLEGRAQDHLLPAQPPGDAHQPEHDVGHQVGADPPTGGGKPDPAIAPLVDEPAKKTFTDEEAIACSLENPESCEACD